MQWSIRRGCVAALVALFGAVGVGAVGSVTVAEASTGPGSQVVASPWTATNPPAIPGSTVADGPVSCTSSVFCVTVVTTQGSSATTPQVQQWNGSAWTTVTLPVPTGATEVSLASVSCTSSSFCVVAGGIVFGGDGPLPALYQWNGSSWSGALRRHCPAHIRPPRLRASRARGRHGAWRPAALTTPRRAPPTPSPPCGTEPPGRSSRRRASRVIPTTRSTPSAARNRPAAWRWGATRYSAQDSTSRAQVRTRVPPNSARSEWPAVTRWPMSSPTSQRSPMRLPKCGTGLRGR